MVALHNFNLPSSPQVQMMTASGECICRGLHSIGISMLFQNIMFQPPFPPEQLLGSRISQCQPIALFVENASFDN
jgi:hypothetical protein